MCTVTFLPLDNNNFILTSNRDEQKLRETLAPKHYNENGVEMLFPKDKMAGGTWIGTSSKKRLICILNGGFVNHEKKSNYRKSRGVTGKEMLQANSILDYVEGLDLEGVEPFTMIIIDWNDKNLCLYELIWDEKSKRFNKLKNEAKIWSSSTLYEEPVKELRRQWFRNWVAENKFNSESILAFHHSEIGDKEQSVLMKRSNVETVSITLVKKQEDSIEMLYEDVVHSNKKMVNF